MPRLITTDEQLHRHLPNIISPARGETPLIERLLSHIEMAERWALATFTPEFYTGITDVAERLVVAEAMRRAIPSLDIVLTPNGFGVVSTQTLTPASKARVESLTASMLELRDEAVGELLTRLPTIGQWRHSPQAEWFSQTLFPDLSFLSALHTPPSTDKWDKYVELRPQILDIEASLAEEWFSPELMQSLRTRSLGGSLSTLEKHLVSAVRAQVISFLRTAEFNSRRLSDIVNFIRSNPEGFPLWHSSATAQLFSPPKFTNKKSNAGYFF